MFFCFPAIIDAYKQYISGILFQCLNIFFVIYLGNSALGGFFPRQENDIRKSHAAGEFPDQKVILLGAEIGRD